MCLIFFLYQNSKLNGLFAVIGIVLVNIQVSRTPVWGQGLSVVGDPAGCSKAEDPAHEIGWRCLWTNQNNLTLEMNGNTGNDWLIFLNFSGFNYELCTFRTPDSNKAKYGTMRKKMNNHTIQRNQWKKHKHQKLDRKILDDLWATSSYN